MEYITIKLTKTNFDNLIEVGALDAYEVKEVSIEDSLFDNDELDKAYKKKSLKAYKEWQEYRFRKRNGMPLK